MMNLRLEVIFEYQAIPADEMWQAVVTGMPSTFPTNIQYELIDKSYALNDVSTAIKRRGKPHFGITCDVGEVQYGAVGNSYLSQLFLEEGLVKTNADAIAWMQTLALLPGFVHARAYEREYAYWQNADDPLQYQAAGRSMEGLPMKSNGLPYPLEQQIIDTSNNPGRRILRRGYVEAVGHLMWFGDRFWKITRQERRIPDWVEFRTRTAGVDFLTIRHSPFVEGDRSENLQDRVREFFFPKHVEEPSPEPVASDKPGKISFRN